jgi:hypothetical protein
MQVLTTTAKQDPLVGNLTGRLLADLGVASCKQHSSWKHPKSDLRRILGRDYIRDLRRNLGCGDLQRLLSAAREVSPRWNVEPIASMPIQALAQLAKSLRLHFNAAPCPGANGLALRGFYVNKVEAMLKRPLIYVNSAHHPLAVSTTFCHEIGHHLAAKVLTPPSSSAVLLFFDADYSCHLDEPAELAADALVSLAGYPNPLARRIFSGQSSFGVTAPARSLTEDTILEIREHLERWYGFDFPAPMSPIQRVRYLCGMIHYAKLRWALLTEYKI